VGVVLVGEPDPPEHLDAGLGDRYRALEGDRRGDVGRERPLLVVSKGHRGDVPGSGGHRLRRLEHLGTQVLDRLEAADRLAELLAHLGVVDGDVEAPAGDPGRLGGRERDRGPAHQVSGQAGHGRDVRAGQVDPHRTETPAQVDARGR
jgi:hypothetical protein